jgi:hypothetical protein
VKGKAFLRKAVPSESPNDKSDGDGTFLEKRKSSYKRGGLKWLIYPWNFVVSSFEIQ